MSKPIQNLIKITLNNTEIKNSKLRSLSESAERQKIENSPVPLEKLLKYRLALPT